MSKCSASAKWYAEHGFRILPLHTIKDGGCTCGNPNCKSAGKHPIADLAPHGVSDATTDAETVERWWKANPNANIGIATGNDLMVLDVDPRHLGDESLQDLITEYGNLPHTPEVITGGGGRHFYFLGESKNAVNIVPGLDIRGTGGFVVAPPSLHASGREYTWEASSSIRTTKIAPVPPWILALDPASEAGGNGNGTAKRLDPEGYLDGVEEGSRHDQIMRYASSLRARNATKDEAIALVTTKAKNCKPPYTDETPEAIVEDIWRRFPAGSSFVRDLTEEASEAPLVTKQERSVAIEWVSKQVKALARGLKEHSDGRITGHLSIETTLPGTARSLKAAQFTFTALRSRTELAKDLSQKVNNINWDTIIEFLCGEVTRYMQRGDPTMIVTPEDSFESTEFAIFPLLLHRHPTILDGHEGSAKSLIALLVAYVTVSGATGIADRLGLQIRVPLKSLLYLDWEGDVNVLRQRLSMLRTGMGLPTVGFQYRRCKKPLLAESDAIRSNLTSKPDLIIIDSLIPAAGGDVKETQPANDFFEALASFDCTTLIVAHPTKAAANTANATVFGSAVFQQRARSTWEVRRDQEEGDNTILVGLVHKKMNYGRREVPLGFRFNFGEDGRWLSVAREDVADVPSIESARTVSTRILGYLIDNGKSSPKEIAEGIGADQNSVRSVLQFLRKHGKVFRIERGLWGAAAEPKSEKQGEPSEGRGRRMWVE